MTNDMSTQVSGRYEEVMAALTRGLPPTFERDGKSIFVMKVLGPLGLPPISRDHHPRNPAHAGDPRHDYRRGLRRARVAAQPPVLDIRRGELGGRGARRRTAAAAD